MADVARWLRELGTNCSFFLQKLQATKPTASQASKITRLAIQASQKAQTASLNPSQRLRLGSA
jgi:hypothetical protein